MDFTKLEEIYGKLTKPHKQYHIDKNNFDIVYCEVCNKNPAKFGKREIRKDGKYVGSINSYVTCSRECMFAKMKATQNVIDKTNQIERWKKTVEEKYGGKDAYKELSKRSVESQNERLLEEHKNDIEKTSFLNNHYKDITLSQRLWHIRNNKLELELCICGKPSKYTIKHGYASCSKECANKRTGISVKINNNKPERIEKFKNSLITNLGNDPYAIIYDKLKQTNIKKYGNENPILSNSIRFKEYDRYFEQKQKYIGDKYILIDCQDEDNIVFYHKECGSLAYSSGSMILQRKRISHEICTECNSINESYSEREFINYIKSVYKGKVIEKIRKLIYNKVGDKKQILEVDVYLPEIGIAFEFNGSHWHSNEFKNDSYHENKYLKCREKGIKLYQIWEDQWVGKENIVKSTIKFLICPEYKEIGEFKFIKIEDKISIDTFIQANSINIPLEYSNNLALVENNTILGIALINNEGILEFHTNLEYSRNLIITVLFSKLLEKRKGWIVEVDNDIEDYELYWILGFKRIGFKMTKYKINKRIRDLRYNFETVLEEKDKVYEITTSGKTIMKY